MTYEKIWERLAPPRVDAASSDFCRFLPLFHRNLPFFAFNCFAVPSLSNTLPVAKVDIFCLLLLSIAYLNPDSGAQDDSKRQHP